MLDKLSEMSWASLWLPTQWSGVHYLLWVCVYACTVTYKVDMYELNTPEYTGTSHFTTCKLWISCPICMLCCEYSSNDPLHASRVKGSFKAHCIQQLCSDSHQFYVFHNALFFGYDIHGHFTYSRFTSSIYWHYTGHLQWRYVSLELCIRYGFYAFW